MGEDGYIRIEMFTDQCLITSEPTSAKVKQTGPRPPTFPPNPMPSNIVTVKQCLDAKCSVDCSTTASAENTCLQGLPATIGIWKSYEAKCLDDKKTVSFTEWRDPWCSGNVWRTMNYTVNTCVAVSEGLGFNTFSC